jgi:succinyl-diaminopimelate desuccinylase
MQFNPIDLARQLIQFPSVTPRDVGIIDFLCKYLTPYGFVCKKLVFSDVTNLYARFGNNGPNLCFAGHTDVVPVGGEWLTDPFSAVIKDGMLYGRGAADMKAAIAAFIIASLEFTHAYRFDGSISLLITGDEEGEAINGTVKVLEYLKQENEKLSACIVGEPTCSEAFGDIIKHGRRGSINFHLTVKGKQGHVAYPHLADNPIDKMLIILRNLKQLVLDRGNEDFTASNLEITNIKINNLATNVIPAQAEAFFNIRFNNLHNQESLYKLIKEICPDEQLTMSCGSDAFIGAKDPNLINCLNQAVFQVTGLNPSLSTTGGTSDARFIKNYCPVLEFGLLNKTAHHIDEHVAVEDIIKLKDVYLIFLKQYFHR